jgi:hypothetical protein
VLQNAGAFSIFKLGTAEHPCSDQYAPAERGLPQLRLQVNSVAASINHRQLLEHPLVKEAVAYWSEALDVINSAGVTVKTSSVSACPCIFVVVSSKCAIIAAMRLASRVSSRVCGCQASDKSHDLCVCRLPRCVGYPAVLHQT